MKTFTVDLANRADAEELLRACAAEFHFGSKEVADFTKKACPEFDIETARTRYSPSKSLVLTHTNTSGVRIKHRLYTWDYANLKRGTTIYLTSMMGLTTGANAALSQFNMYHHLKQGDVIPDIAGFLQNFVVHTNQRFARWKRDYSAVIKTGIAYADLMDVEIPKPDPLDALDI